MAQVGWLNLRVEGHLVQSYINQVNREHQNSLIITMCHSLRRQHYMQHPVVCLSVCLVPTVNSKTENDTVF